MFVLNELERLLQNAPDEQQQIDRRAKAKIRDIERVDVNNLSLFKNVKLREIDIRKELTDYHDPFDLRAYISNRNYLTLDILFASLMKPIVLTRLAQMPERSFPAARLMICDHEAYRYLLKFQYVAKRIFSGHDEHKYLLHKPPFNVSAVILLSDIVNLLDRIGRPIARFQHETSVLFDYSIIKQIFPYLKITDVIVALGEIGNLKLHTLTLGASKSHQTIQFITHFARSAQLIEFLPIKTRLGEQHLLFDNCCVFRVPNFTESASSPTAEVKKDKPQQQPIVTSVYLAPTLLQLSFLAHRLHQLIGQLDWHLDSITFRLGDPSGFSKIFSQILDSTYKSESSVSSSKRSKRHLSLVPVRVLVLDRFFDLQGLLRHTDRYGPFLEQESLFSSSDGLATLRLDKVDPLDGLLQCASLTDALKTILDYSASVANTTEPAKKSSSTHQAHHAKNINQSSKTHSIRRHLDIAKSIYRSMNEGYLLILKLESSLANIIEKVRQSRLDAKDEDQMGDIIERLDRIGLVLEQLSTLANKSLAPLDTYRVALLLVDTLNANLFLCREQSRQFQSLASIKRRIINRKEFNATIKLVEDQRDVGLKRAKAGPKREEINLGETFDAFDAISIGQCEHRSAASIEEIIEQFYSRKLDSKSYRTLKRTTGTHGLVKKVSRNKIIVLVLGAISYDELTRIKHLESVLMKKRVQGKSSISDQILGDILITCTDVIRPDEFIGSLF